jgi:hypothetical protein
MLINSGHAETVKSGRFVDDASTVEAVSSMGR